MRTPNLILSSLVLAVFTIGALASISAAAADPVYKWKDANGQSHYSQQVPPSGVKYDTINPTGTSASTTGAGSSTSATANHAATPAKVSPDMAYRQKNCVTARNNVALLANNPTANIDTKGTGKPASVTSAQRAAEMDRANQQVAQYCGK